MIVDRRLLALCLIVAGLGAGFGSAPALAQYPPVQSNEVEIATARTCLCLERAVAERKFEMDVRNGIFEKAQGDLQATEAEVERQRPTVNVNDPAQVDAFRTLLAKRDAARAQYERVAVPDQQQAVGRYNAVVEQLNATCNRPITTFAWEAARKDLVCPKN